MLLLATSDVGTREVRVTPPTVDPDTATTMRRPHLIDARYDLAKVGSDASDYRLGELDATAVPERRGRPLAVAAIDDERQRLVIGVKPGTGKNKLGFAYRLRFGR